MCYIETCALTTKVVVNTIHLVKDNIFLFVSNVILG